VNDETRVDLNDEDLRRPVREDPVHHLIVRRIEQMERMQAEFDKWRVKADIMLDGIAHFKADMDLQFRDQTSELKREFISINEKMDEIKKSQTFWANAMTIGRWAVGILVSLAVATWAVGTFIYQQMHGTK
jgi:hypothetical protein